MTKEEKIKELRDKARRTRDAVSSNAGPSSQEWISPERYLHYMTIAQQYDAEADKLEGK